MKRGKLPDQNSKDSKALVTRDTVTLRELIDLLGGKDKTELAMFFMEWLNNGMNAKNAYLKFHPNITDRSAMVLGSRELRKVDIPLILEALDMGTSSYFEQLKAGLNAGKTFILKKYDKNGKIVKELSSHQPDHKTRRLYHEAQGKMLGFETNSPTSLVQNNFNIKNLGAAIKRDSIARGLPYIL